MSGGDKDNQRGRWDGTLTCAKMSIRSAAKLAHVGSECGEHGGPAGGDYETYDRKEAAPMQSSPRMVQ